MTEPIKILRIEINNIRFAGGILKKGGLNFVTNRDPDFIYTREGNSFFAEDDGFVDGLQHDPGTTDGFAGRSFTLPVHGGGVVFPKKGITRLTFKGSLWHTMEPFTRFTRKTGKRVFSCGQRNVRSRYQVFSYCYITEDRLREVIGLLDIHDELKGLAS